MPVGMEDAGTIKHIRRCLYDIFMLAAVKGKKCLFIMGILHRVLPGGHLWKEIAPASIVG